jgi:ferredoxin
MIKFTRFLRLVNKEIEMAHVIDESCIGCGACMAECPADAIQEGDPYTIDANLCTDCGACVEVCPTESISQN